MGDPTGEADRGALRLDFDRRLLLQFRSSAVPHARTGKNGRYQLGAFCANRCFRSWRVALMASSSWSHSFLTDKNWQLWPDVPADRALHDALETGGYAKWHAYKTDQIEESGQREVLNSFLL